MSDESGKRSPPAWSVLAPTKGVAPAERESARSIFCELAVKHIRAADKCSVAQSQCLDHAEVFTACVELSELAATGLYMYVLANGRARA